MNEWEHKKSLICFILAATEQSEGEPMMFDILSVNAYGSQTLMKLNKDGSELKLGGACAQLCVYACLCSAACVLVYVCMLMYVHCHPFKIVHTSQKFTIFTHFSSFQPPSSVSGNGLV